MVFSGFFLHYSRVKKRKLFGSRPDPIYLGTENEVLRAAVNVYLLSSDVLSGVSSVAAG